MRYIIIYLPTGFSSSSDGDDELLGVSPGSKICPTFLNIAKHGEKKMTFQFTGTAPEPEINSI